MGRRKVFFDLSKYEREEFLSYIENWQQSIHTTREIFALCLVLAELGVFDKRIENYLALVEKKQDRNSESETFGNFTYYLDSEKVVDLNAVEFCLREGFLLWIRHKYKLNEKTRNILEQLIRYGIKAVLTRVVQARYTNIYLIKTWNKIAYGENFEDEEIRTQGYRMLDEWLSYTQENGIGEYSSPNYYHNDITALGLIYNHAKNKEARRKSKIGLHLFWTDIALNFFKPASRLGGSKSRDYDYIYGRNGIGRILAYYGWIDKKRKNVFDYLIALSKWRPPESIKKYADKYPRFIERKIGSKKGEWACHYVGKQFSLGCCGFCYSPLDKPLVFLFPSNELPNGYAVFDARNDPYGEKHEKQPWSGFEHQVCLHLVPFITAHQNREEIVMYARIKADDPSIPRIAPDVQGFYTHFVFPFSEIFVDEKKIALKSGEKRRLTVGQVVIVKYKSAAIGIRIFYATDLDSQVPEIFLINDGNKYNVLRLTVIHADKKEERGNGEIGFFMKGRDDMESDCIMKFYQSIKNIQFKVDRDRNGMMKISKNSEILLHFNPDKSEIIIDTNVKHILSMNGKDIGRKILNNIHRSV